MFSVLLFTFILLLSLPIIHLFFFFFFNDTATTEIYTLSLHDALPIFNCLTWPYDEPVGRLADALAIAPGQRWYSTMSGTDRKSTRLNSSHGYISYAVFCLKKKKKIKFIIIQKYIT